VPEHFEAHRNSDEGDVNDNERVGDINGHQSSLTYPIICFVKRPRTTRVDVEHSPRVSSNSGERQGVRSIASTLILPQFKHRTNAIKR
jgi:hypothetical protein